MIKTHYHHGASINIHSLKCYEHTHTYACINTHKCTHTCTPTHTPHNTTHTHTPHAYLNPHSTVHTGSTCMETRTDSLALQPSPTHTLRHTDGHTHTGSHKHMVTQPIYCISRLRAQERTGMHTD